MTGIRASDQTKEPLVYITSEALIISGGDGGGSNSPSREGKLRMSYKLSRRLFSRLSAHCRPRAPGPADVYLRRTLSVLCSPQPG